MSPYTVSLDVDLKCMYMIFTVDFVHELFYVSESMNMINVIQEHTL